MRSSRDTANYVASPSCWVWTAPCLCEHVRIWLQNTRRIVADNSLPIGQPESWFYGNMGYENDSRATRCADATHQAARCAAQPETQGRHRAAPGAWNGGVTGTVCASPPTEAGAIERWCTPHDTEHRGRYRRGPRVVIVVDISILAYLTIQGDRTSAAQRLYARIPNGGAKDSSWWSSRTSLRRMCARTQ